VNGNGGGVNGAGGRRDDSRGNDETFPSDRGCV